MNVLAHWMDPTDTSRRHQMHCLARHLGALPPGAMENWLHRFAKTHSAELVQWLRKSASQHRANLAVARTQPPPPFVKNREAGQQGIDAARRALL